MWHSDNLLKTFIDLIEYLNTIFLQQTDSSVFIFFLGFSVPFLVPRTNRYRPNFNSCLWFKTIFKNSLNFEIENLSWFRKSGRSVWNTLMTLVKFINLSRKTRFCFLLQHFKVFKTFPAPPLRRNWRGRSVRITILMISKL